MLTPTTTFADCPQLDVICVPGGAGTNDMVNDEEMLDFLRQQAAGAKYITSVCTGSLVLGAAGLLQGISRGDALDRDGISRAFGATPTKTRVCVDRNRITGGGVTAGIDFALTLVSILIDRPPRKRSSCGSNTIRRRHSMPARPTPRRRTFCAHERENCAGASPPRRAIARRGADGLAAEKIVVVIPDAAPAAIRNLDTAMRRHFQSRACAGSKLGILGKEKGRLVSQTAFPVSRQLHIDGRSQNLCTGGLSPGRILIGCRCIIGTVANWSPNRRDGLPSP